MFAICPIYLEDLLKLTNEKDISVDDCLSAAKDTSMQSLFEAYVENNALPQYWVDLLNDVGCIDHVTPDSELPFCIYINEGQKTQPNLLNASHKLLYYMY